MSCEIRIETGPRGTAPTSCSVSWKETLASTFASPTTARPPASMYVPLAYPWADSDATQHSVACLDVRRRLRPGFAVVDLESADHVRRVHVVDRQRRRDVVEEVLVVHGTRLRNTAVVAVAAVGGAPHLDRGLRGGVEELRRRGNGREADRDATVPPQHAAPTPPRRIQLDDRRASRDPPGSRPPESTPGRVAGVKIVRGTRVSRSTTPGGSVRDHRRERSEFVARPHELGAAARRSAS